MEGSYHPVVCVGRIHRCGAGWLWVLNEILATVEHKLGPSAVQCEPQASPDLLKKDGLAHLGVDVKELELLSRKRGGERSAMS